MIQREYMLIDVFTREPFGGSRLTLFPEGEGLSEGLMQSLANEMGTGETAFVLPGSGGENRAGLRIFTPSGEIPFASLSLLGAVCGLDILGRVSHDEAGTRFVCEVDAGSFAVELGVEDGATVYSLTHQNAVFIGQYYQRAKVAKALGLDEKDIAITGLPCEIVSTGLPIHLVPVGSLDAVRGIRVSRAAAMEIAIDLGFGDLFAFTCETEDPQADVHCRMFAPDLGIPEDSASGSACGSLVAYLIKHRLVQPASRVRIVCEQGIEVGRPSRLFVDAEVADGEARRIRVGGHCVLIGQGRINLPEDSCAD